jgi:hypothetical protein
MNQSNMTSYDTINSFLLPQNYFAQNKYLFFDIFINNNKLFVISPVYIAFPLNYDSIQIKLINNDTKIQLIKEKTFSNYNNEKFYITIYGIPETLNKQEQIEVIYYNITNTYYLEKYYAESKQNKFLLTTTTLFKDDWNLFDVYYKYYSNQGVEYFYMYYNGKSTEEIKNKFLYPNVKLIDWNFEYWELNMYAQHVAQIGHLQHSLYKYGKIQTQYMIYNDFDEFMFIPNVTLKEFILNPQHVQENINTIGFLNHWCITLDGKTFQDFPEKFLKSSKKFNFTNRSKCIHKVELHDYIHIHWPADSKNKIIVNDNLFLFHFANWNNKNRTYLENPQIFNINPLFKDKLNKSVE